MTDDGIQKARARRWWQSGRPLGRIDRAARFVNDVGFALLFPKTGIELPSLWEATTDRPLHTAEHDWGPDMDKVWTWKDELPRRGLCWYGEFVRGRKSFLSPTLLNDLYPRSGSPDDIAEGTFSTDANRIARILLSSGPQPTAALREALDVEGRTGADRFSRAVGELGRALVITNFGTEEEGGGWPSAVLELTTRAFAIAPVRDPQASRLNVARTFLDTMITAQPNHLGNAFHMRAAEARAAFKELVELGEAERDGPSYRLLPRPAG
jgi:hypothetical protein